MGVVAAGDEIALGGDHDIVGVGDAELVGRLHGADGG